jgi:hypothetical protein
MNSKQQKISDDPIGWKSPEDKTRRHRSESKSNGTHVNCLDGEIPLVLRYPQKEFHNHSKFESNKQNTKMMQRNKSASLTHEAKLKA